MSARLAKLPSDLPPHPGADDDKILDEEVDEESEAQDGLGSLSMPSPKSRQNLKKNAESSDADHNPTYAPLSASTHFEQAIQVAVPSSDLDFRVYMTPSVASSDATTGSMMVCHHGAGYSALSFACLAKAVTGNSKGECGIMAFDARAHGLFHL